MALALTTATGAVSTAFAANRVQQQQAVNVSPYDTPDFVVRPTNIEP